MHRPILVTPPSELPVTLDEAKQFVIVEAAEDDAVLESLLEAATAVLDGWNGILGRCIVEQTWRQDFDCFAQNLPLPLLPVKPDGVSVTYLDGDGQERILPSSAYSLVTHAGGASHVQLARNFTRPSVFSAPGCVSVSFVAGSAREAVPRPIKTAITMLVAQWFNNREATVTGTIATELPLAVEFLISPFKVRSI